MKRWWESPEFQVERDGRKFYEVRARDVWDHMEIWPVTEEAMRKALELPEKPDAP